MKVKHHLSLLLLSLLLTLPASAADLHIMDAWVREAPPGAKVLAAYMEIHNGGNTAVKLVKVTSTSCKSIELHKTEMDNGMARMKQQDAINIEGKEQVSLAPGGLHLMLMDPVHNLKAGDQVELQLSFSDGTSQTVQAAVRKATGEMHGHDGAHHHN